MRTYRVMDGAMVVWDNGRLESAVILAQANADIRQRVMRVVDAACDAGLLAGLAIDEADADEDAARLA